MKETSFSVGIALLPKILEAPQNNNKKEGNGKSLLPYHNNNNNISFVEKTFTPLNSDN